MPDIERIAASLTKAQRQLIIDGPGNLSGLSMQATEFLDGSPAFKPGFNRETRDFGYILTPLGLAVREILTNGGQDG